MARAAESKDIDLRSLTDGLTYTSEMDAPVEPVHWHRADGGGTLSKEDVLKLAGQSPSIHISTASVRDFFEPVAGEADWQDEEERKSARKFQDLEKALEGLKGTKVYKIGSNPMDVYVLGETPEGDVVGVKTRMVET